VQHRGARKQGTGNRVAQVAYAELVDRPLLVEQVEDAPDLVAVVGGQVEPCE